MSQSPSRPLAPCFVFFLVLGVGCEGTAGPPMNADGSLDGARRDGGRDAAQPGADVGLLEDSGQLADAAQDAPIGMDAGIDAGLLDSGPPPSMVFEEVDGLVAVEAEHFTANDANGTPRDWYVTAPGMIPGVTPDPDEPHTDDASSATYVEGLPDTRVTPSDPIVSGESFFNTPGTGPILTYRVRFNTPGTYYVWGRALTTGPEDNGLHVGIDGDWPASGTRMQWCGTRGTWLWKNAQRDSGGSSCGVDGTITIEVDAPGEHMIHFSMREDGFEFDKFILTQDAGFAPTGTGPEERPYTP